MINIIAVETNKGVFISRTDSNYSKSLKHLLFDGETPQDTFHADWSFIAGKPKKVSHYEKQPDINHRFVLIDANVVNSLPVEISRDDAGHFADDCDSGKYFVWNDELAMYRSLYAEVSDPQDDKEVAEEFSFNVVFKVDNITPPDNFKYPTNERRISYSDKKVIDNVTNATVEHQLLDKIIFPTILLPETPCRLSSKQSYDVVRWHIKQNINLKVSRITSDYDFCFTVVKLITLDEPFTKPSEYTPSGRGRRKPVVENRLVSTREVKLFEMTHSEAMYKGYTPIQCFEADNETALKEQIDVYLNQLMEHINEPLVDCPECKGRGVLFGSKPDKEAK